jgi:hypothetical protein
MLIFQIAGITRIEMYNFKKSQYYPSVNKTRKFMFEDLDKTINLINTKRRAPNFLLALVLCCYTEYWGRLVNGISECNSEKCFNEFFDRLGNYYQQQRKQSTCDVYKDIRCGLVHSYLVSKSAKIKIKGGKCGVVFNPSTKEYTFYVERYFHDFKDAVDRYISGLANGSERLAALMEDPTQVPSGNQRSCKVFSKAAIYQK